jgi:hypothetical protein
MMEDLRYFINHQPKRELATCSLNIRHQLADTLTARLHLTIHGFHKEHAVSARGRRTSNNFSYLAMISDMERSSLWLTRNGGY